MKRMKVFIFSFFIIFASLSLLSANGTETEKTNEQTKEVQSASTSFRYLSAAIAVGVACLAGGFAVGKIGAAAMGAMSEKPELSGKAIPFVGLAEGICLWGFLVALLIILL